MKILSTPQLREADAFTIANEPIASIDLMERAASAVFDWVVQTLPDDAGFSIVCGTGNNGGDGLALARMLGKLHRRADVYIVWVTEEGSHDFTLNLTALQSQGRVKIHDIRQMEDIPSFAPDDIIVDAIFGSGLSRPVVGLAAAVIRRINESGAPIIAIDIPSGLFSDEPGGEKAGEIVRATHTLTFQFPKLAFLFPESQDFVGDWTVLPIGLHEDYLKSVDASQYFITASDARNILKPRRCFDHKGIFGHALIIAGNPGKLGAAVLAAEACLRSGPGLLTINLPPEGIPILQTAVPEAMVNERPGDFQFLPIKELEQFTSIAVGPGIGTTEATSSALKELIQNASVPLILDADALNILAENKTWLAFLPKSSILTPHPKEFERLAGKSPNSFDRMQMQKEMSMKYSLYIILKGAHTCITTPLGECWFNSTGNPGMATGGSGDTLTGILAGLMAQCYSPLESALLGVWIHGFAADLALEESSWEAILPSDVTGMLGSAFRWLRE